MSNLDSALSSLGLAPSLARDLNSFLDLFEKWNRSINLSAASTRAELVEHVVDSLQIVPQLAGVPRVLDVGSGGGFPLVVAAICAPESNFMGLEPVHKKHAFLRTAARELHLANLSVLAERHEDHATHDYELAMSRATFDLVEWFALARPFVRPGGRIVGFEATTRTDLPAGITRHPYALGNKTRALLSMQV